MPAALHRIQFRWEGGLGLDLEWTKGRGTISALPDLQTEVTYTEIEVEPDLATSCGIPPIFYRSDTPVLFEPFQLRENTDYFVDLTLPMSRNDAEAEIAQQPGWPFNPRLAKVFQIDPARRWRTDDQGRLIISGLLRLRNHAGILDLRTPFGSGLRMEVVCQKIGYLDEFRMLLDRVADELAELLLKYDSPVSAGFNISDVSSANEAGLLFQLRHIMSVENLPVSVDEILNRLHASLYAKHAIVNFDEVEEPDFETLASELDITSLRPGGPLRRFFRGHTPSSFPILEQYETTDTPENRYIKYFLEEVQLLSTRLRDRLTAAGKHASAREAATWADQIEELLSKRLWKDVGQFRQFPSNSQLLQKGRGYRDILRYDLSLRMGLELPWKRAGELAEGTYGDLRPVNELYEYWCFFILRRAVADACLKEKPGQSTLVQVSSDGLRISLRKGRRSKASFIYKETTEAVVEVNLFYNRSFRRPNKRFPSWLGSYTASFDPDYSLEVVVTRQKSSQHHWLHFDAKYRLDRAGVDSIFDDEIVSQSYDDEADDSSYDRELKRIHKQDDLFKMHTYRDGILSSRGAYIIYPGEDEGVILEGKRQNLFVRHPSAFSGKPAYKIPSVGAFSLSPGKEAAQRPVISDFIRNIFEVLSTSASYVDETGII